MNELPGTPADQLNALLRLLLPFARGSVAATGELDPLGAPMAVDGELETAQGDGESDEALRSIRSGFRERAGRGEVVAVGVASLVALDDDAWPHGVRIELEHLEGTELTLIHPYRRAEDATTWGEPFRMPGPGRGEDATFVHD
jgi:hypothetical protein